MVKLLAALLGTCAVVSGCAADDVFDAEDPGEGVGFDQDNDDYDFGIKADQARQYDIPDWVLETELRSPEIVVSLDGLTVHLFDRGSEFSRVYPTGVGAIGASGNSITPTGFFATSPNPGTNWWNIPDRFAPAYFGGFPFVRLTTHNSRRQATYGLHGPISFTCRRGPTNSSCALEDRDWYLRRDYVSHGCMRMRADDIVEVYYLLDGQPSVPVTIQRDVEVDPVGNEIVIEDVATDWPITLRAEDDIVYGELGPRPDDWDPCIPPAGWPHRSYGC